MRIEWDDAKNAADRARHGLDFAEFEAFDELPTASIDDRFDYGEVRYRAFGRIDGVPHAIVFTQQRASCA